MQVRRLARAAAAAVLFTLACASCQGRASPPAAASGPTVCVEALKGLDAADQALSDPSGSVEDYNAAVAAVERTCDRTRMEVGMKLADAKLIQHRWEGMQQALERIVPSGNEQSRQLEMKKLWVYSVKGMSRQARASLETLKSIPADPVTLRLAKSQFECRFGHCGLALGMLRDLSRRYPQSAQIHALLGFALADRQEFDAAATEFARAFAINPSAFDEPMALAAVVSFCNVGSPNDAREVLKDMEGTWGRAIGVSPESLRRMHAMVDDTSGRRFQLTAPRNN